MRPVLTPRPMPVRIQDILPRPDLAAPRAGAATEARKRAIDGKAALIELDRSLWSGGGLPLPDGPADRAPTLTIRRVPIQPLADAAGGAGVVDLTLSRFSILTPGTRFVIGHKGRPDEPLAFDPESVVLYRGAVVGMPASRVFLTLSASGSAGTIDLGPGRGRYHVSSRATDGGELPVGQLTVFPAARPAGAIIPDLPLCVARAAPAGGPDGGDAPPAIKGLRQLELAIETDYELFELFGSADATAAYVVQLYAAVSDIYTRELNIRVDLSYVRLWPTPDDLFNDPDPLTPFKTYWEDKMKSVKRDAAQFFSGRRNLPAGGVAWLSSLCNQNAYSWAGYALGFFADPATPSWTNRDVMVTAHELGHNCGTGHNQDYAIDRCDNPDVAPVRGGIMSYCGQSYTGGDANQDMRFETLIRGKVAAYAYARACLAADCNQNHLPDSADITSGFSKDDNANGVPDECEDCNGNGVLDTLDISTGASKDLNRNGVPDECEPDCNKNGVPDDKDIADKTSKDRYMNAVPDECERNCDGDELADFDQIMADMGKDINRNTILDACEDCDGDGITDLAALDEAHHFWAASYGSDRALREYFSTTGVLTRVSDADKIDEANDLITTPDKRVLVTSGADSRVVEFTRKGVYVGDLVAAGAGGLTEPGSMLLSPGGGLLVASTGSNSVIEYDAATGALRRVLIPDGSGGLLRPFGLTFGPAGGSGGAGGLYVTSDDGQVLEFDAATGAFVRVFVKAADNGGLNTPRGLLFLADGSLLVCSQGSDAVLQYSAGTGAFIKKWNRNGTATVLTLEAPWAIRYGPRGHVFVSMHHADPLTGELHLTNASIYEFDPRNGNYVQALIQGKDSGLTLSTGFDFVPGDDIDCNRNAIPDSCDIASGRSRDINRNGKPDECECLPDLDGDGKLTVSDFATFQNLFALGDPRVDFNGDGKLDIRDFVAYQNAFALGCQ